jgi:hypothetical protein
VVYIWLMGGLSHRGVMMISVLLHAANVAGSFVLARSTLTAVGCGGRGRAAAEFPAIPDACTLLSAAVIGLHPARVEVVAWASCQPYLVMTLLAIGCALAHDRAR